MAGDCPHNAHLAASLKHYHDSSQVIAATHETYLKIIDELKNDLDQMSSEVVKVQNECIGRDQDILDDDGGDLVTSLKELETQNDRLQQALVEETQTKDAALTELQTNNESLKCQIQHLNNLLMERDQHILYLKSLLSRTPSRQHVNPCLSKAVEYGPSTSECCASNRRIGGLEKRIETLSTELDKSQRQEHFLHSETRKLNEELNESKRRNGDLVGKAHRLAGLLKKHETHHLELASKYEDLERNFEDQAKQLRTANAQLAMLNERFQMMEKLQAENNMERNLLRGQVLSLKEKEAVVMGRQKSAQEQLLKTEKELVTAHDVIKEQQSIMQRNENNHADILKRLKDENYDVKRKLNSLFEDHKRLQEEREKEKEIIKQYEKILESFRKWKECQLNAEAEIRQQLQKYAEFIQLLQEENQKCLQQYNNLHQDYVLLQVEMERAKKSAFSFSHPNISQSLSERSIAERLEFIRRTKLHISEQSSSLQGEAPMQRPQHDTGPSAAPTQKSNEKQS